MNAAVEAARSRPAAGAKAGGRGSADDSDTTGRASDALEGSARVEAEVGARWASGITTFNEGGSSDGGAGSGEDAGDGGGEVGGEGR
jgi:hypothetical protein